MKNLLIVFWMCLGINMFADNPTPHEKTYPFNYGRMQDSVYSNPFFGFSISIPSSWKIQNKTQVDYIVSKGKDLINSKDEEVNKAIDKLDINNMVLLMATKYEMGAPVDYNPSLGIMAENVLMTPGIKRGSDYLFHVRKGIEASNMSYHFEEGYDSLAINKYVFDILSCNRESSATNQKYITAIIKHYAFSFILTYSTEQEKNELLSILNTITFK